MECDELPKEAVFNPSIWRIVVNFVDDDLALANGLGEYYGK